MPPKKIKKIIKKATVKKASKPKKTAAKTKTVVKKVIKKKEVLAGEVVHYFDHIKVAVIKLKTALVVGNDIRIVGGENTDFKQKVQSMEIEHKKISKAKKGQEVGMKVREKIRDGYKVFKA